MDKKGVTGPLSFMAFLMFLLLAAWCVNIYRHIRAGGWKGFIAAVDVVGALILAGGFVALLVPLLR
ncbi:MAG: hypothetical protein Q4A05_03620 [Ruminococcus sp.]|nr:hypothetical protein [Ruminococcus sp.]